MFWQSKNSLACNFLFCFANHPAIFGMPVPLFGLPFGTWHAAILRRVSVCILQAKEEQTAKQTWICAAPCCAEECLWPDGVCFCELLPHYMKLYVII